MYSINLLRTTLYTFILVTPLAFVGCGGNAVNKDTALYEGDEEATREHMKEVEDEERANFQQQPAQPAQATAAGE
jgi:hypothetical protein